MSIRECETCGNEYEVSSRRNQPGKVTTCLDCAEDNAVKYTGNMIYDHKTGYSIQINSDPRLTSYISKATELRNKGSNLVNNLKVSYNTKGEGRCISTVASSNAKGRKV